MWQTSKRPESNDCKNCTASCLLYNFIDCRFIYMQSPSCFLRYTALLHFLIYLFVYLFILFYNLFLIWTAYDYCRELITEPDGKKLFLGLRNTRMYISSLCRLCFGNAYGMIHKGLFCEYENRSLTFTNIKTFWGAVWKFSRSICSLYVINILSMFKNF